MFNFAGQGVQHQTVRVFNVAGIFSGGKGIDHGACLCAFDGVGKEPILSTYDKGSDCVFSAVVVDGNIAIFQKTLKIFLLVFGVLNCFGELGLSCGCDAFQP